MVNSNDSFALRDAYDALPYTTYPIEATSLPNLATAAALAGVGWVHPSTCRVLEVGAGTGGNLLPMAGAFPDARFVGIDLSPRQIELARNAAQKANLQNI